MINLAWGGHTNGAIDTSELVDISGRGDYVEPTGAAQFLRMQAAIKRDVGFDLQPAAGSSCYRPESIQITFFTQRYTKVSYNTGLWWNGSYWKKNAGAAVAAIPKTSNHGYARAIDLNISRYDVKAWAWMQAHAHEYGYDWATGRASGEDWHWESLTAPGTAVAGGNSSPITTPLEEDDMKPFIYVQSNDRNGSKFSWIVAVGGGLPRAREFTPLAKRADWIKFCDTYNAQAAKQGRKPIEKDLKDATTVNNDEYLSIVGYYS